MAIIASAQAEILFGIYQAPLCVFAATSAIALHS
jgi:hypothetical protein